MNTDKLVPLDFSRNITPFVLDDKLFNTRTGNPFIIDCPLQLAAFNTFDNTDEGVYFVVSYADRPNTGKQPVADDVVVDVCFDNEHTGMAGAIEWSEDDEASTSHETWKLNHAAMVERYQASLADKEDKRMNNIALNESDGSHYKVVSAIEALERFGYKYVGGVWSQQEVKPELAAYMVPHVKPVYTQEMCDAGELPMVGSDAIFKHNGADELGTVKAATDRFIVYSISSGYERVRISANSPCKPVKTDADKLRDALYLELPDAMTDQIADALMGAFIITHKGK